MKLFFLLLGSLCCIELIQNVLGFHVLERGDFLLVRTTAGIAADSSSSGISKVLWSEGRTDRSGSVISDLLAIHAFAYKNKLTMGGSCVYNWTLDTSQVIRHQQHDELLQVLGLKDILPFACPEDPTTRLLTRDEYWGKGTAYLYSNRKYQNYLRSFAPPPLPLPNTATSDNGGGGNNETTVSQDMQQIVVHIRRGDISPCRDESRSFRYLPNSHYLRLIDKYHNPADKRSQVVIYSESDSYEPFDVFRDKGYKVVLDGPVTDVWRAILRSNVFITSPSAFSTIPAVLLRDDATVVYTPYSLTAKKRPPVRRWKQVGEDLLRQTRQELETMVPECDSSQE